MNATDRLEAAAREAYLQATLAHVDVTSGGDGDPLLLGARVRILGKQWAHAYRAKQETNRRLANPSLDRTEPSPSQVRHRLAE